MNTKIPYFIIASTAALVFLIVMQVKWIQKSVDLVEEQFDQKVSMALCMAVDKISETEEKTNLKVSCSLPGTTGKQCCSNDLTLFISNDDVQEVVDEALTFYNINMPFEMEVSEYNDLLKTAQNKEPSYSCSLNPLIDNETHKLGISFPGKRAYVFNKMWLMFLSSIILLLFITGIFVYANYALIKQKRISERNKEFFNHMAHEFKTPLTNIRLATSLLSKKSEDNLVDIISNENKQLSDQVDRVLTMATMESGQYTIKKEPVNLVQLLKEIKTQMQFQLDEKDATLTIHDFSEDAIVLADKFHLSNAIRNIIDNALKYSKKQPKISISLRKEMESLKIQIQDNGIGISNSNQKLLFEKFFRIRDNIDVSTKGFGLGLSYVKKIMELHKGSIAVFSDLQRGSRFDLVIPQSV
ncbi:MAG: HAMP domain-containing sensor histidine kinase [Saprospiraceae bacterium]|nr:HAMP domain-containing sensor histidine kinase [Saprospiraceae bacterium]